MQCEMGGREERFVEGRDRRVVPSNPSNDSKRLDSDVHSHGYQSAKLSYNTVHTLFYKH